MSAKTDNLLQCIEYIDKMLADPGPLPDESIVSLREQRQLLVKQLNEANAALSGKQLLKG